jgi:ATP-dependent Clp protease ATP-binding subunit ClpC
LFERYTERARRVVFFARYETSQLGRAAIETEHLLLGLLREGKGVTSRLFNQSQLSMDQLRRDIEDRVSDHGRLSTSVEVPLSPETRRALGYAAHESAGMGHNYMGTEHLLLGLLRQKGGLAALILGEKGMTLAAARQEMLTVLAKADPKGVGPRPPSSELDAEPPPIELTELDRRFLGALKISAD